MSIVVLRYLALIIAPAITSSARPVMTLLGVQILSLFLVHREMVAAPEAMAWFLAIEVTYVLGALAVLEIIVAHDSDVSALLGDLGIDRVSAAVGAMASTMVLALLGVAEAQEAVGEVEMLWGAGEALSADRDAWISYGIVAAAVGINLVLTWFRSGLLRWIDEFGVRKWWARVETGGIIAVLLLIPFFPLIIGTFALVFALGLLVLSAMVRAGAVALDRQWREPCEGCGYAVRKEASLCPECGREREPTAQPKSGFGALREALRARKVKPGAE